MKRDSLAPAASVAALALLGLATQSQATLRTTSPALDLKADLYTVPNSGGIPTTSTWITVWGSPYQAPSWGAPATIHPFPPFPAGGTPFGYSINTFNDWIVIGNPVGTNWATSTARYAAAAEYITFDDGSMTAGSSMVVTTIYGVDAQPGVPGALAIAGYNSADTYPLLGGEQITGPSGVTYNAGAGQLVPIGGLPALLGAGFDLSPFVGDPNAPVWVFQTSVPITEAVPEPAAFSVLAVAATGLLANRRRKA
jgi:hypothetical protein